MKDRKERKKQPQPAERPVRRWTFGFVDFSIEARARLKEGKQ